MLTSCRRAQTGDGEIASPESATTDIGRGHGNRGIERAIGLENFHGVRAAIGDEKAALRVQVDILRVDDFRAVRIRIRNCADALAIRLKDRNGRRGLCEHVVAAAGIAFDRGDSRPDFGKHTGAREKLAREFLVLIRAGARRRAKNSAR